jgi:NAD(P)H dehydrogenase (quinone)
MQAMLQGFCDRLLMPGVAFDISDRAHVKPALPNLRKMVGFVTYGRPWYMAKWMRDPPREK